jgi:UDP-galactopyranose mutase
MDVLIVGAGFSGAVYARECAEQGHKVHVIDRRNHIAGNAYDVKINGVFVHKYGPHLFHTSNQSVVDWLSRFTDWLPYEHKAKARLSDGRLVPFPLNAESVYQVLGQSISDLNLGTHAAVASDRSAKEFLTGEIGPDLTELFFERYSQKMWALSLDELSADVVKRVKIRNDHETRYFPDDSFQAMPAQGYTALFKTIFDHVNIHVALETAFDPAMESDFDFIFNSMAIDEYFEFKFGPLPYRSIRFHDQECDTDTSQGVATINYTDTGPFTRETHWHRLPNITPRSGRFLKTVEEPCSYEDNGMERYYPVKTADNRHALTYARYRDLAQATLPHMKFIGRCGTYQYLDMHQVINQSLQGFRNWTKKGAV